MATRWKKAETSAHKGATLGTGGGRGQGGLDRVEGKAEKQEGSGLQEGDGRRDGRTGWGWLSRNIPAAGGSQAEGSGPRTRAGRIRTRGDPTRPRPAEEGTAAEGQRRGHRRGRSRGGS